MRVISGTARGTKLYTLEGNQTRPTLDRVKESLFNMINMQIKDATILDLFSGSGAIGIEFISRGAKKAFLCDTSKEAINIIRKNVEKTKMQDKIIILQENFKSCLEKQIEKFDFIYIDPPYASSFAKEAVEIIIKKDLLKSEGSIVIETDNAKQVIEELNMLNMPIEIYKQKKYGRVELLFIRKGSDNGDLYIIGNVRRYIRE